MPNSALASIALLGLVGSLACSPHRSRPDASTPRSDGKTVDQLFVGKFAGVVVTTASSGGLSIRIRGPGTFYGTNEPLYVIDGIPMPHGSTVFFLNPHDIQAIEVLKNPADIGEYGIRGANGVIRITT